MGYKRYTDEEKEAAFRLFCEGQSTRQIGKALGMRPQTVGVWMNAGKWEERRSRIQAEAKQKSDLRITNQIAERLKEHDRAARALRGGAQAALRHELRGLENPDGPTPDPLALQRIAVALKTALQLERQALGLREDGDDVDESPLKVYDTETLRAIYFKAVEERNKLLEEQDGNSSDSQAEGVAP